MPLPAPDNGLSHIDDGRRLQRLAEELRVNAISPQGPPMGPPMGPPGRFAPPDMNAAAATYEAAAAICFLAQAVLETGPPATE